MDLFNYSRRSTTQITIGTLALGGNAPIRVQSMTNTDTNNIEASAAQAKRIVEAGGELVRLTAQGIKEAESLQHIHALLLAQGITTPLVADIHFQPAAADLAAQYVEKVRINPGNYIDKAKRFAQVEYTDHEYAQEIDKIRERFIPFLNICKQHNTAIRIGVNHGSLSDRIMSRYGDTPQGMVESCMEFLRICVAEQFYQVVISIKASNTMLMVQTVRLLVVTMAQENMNFPLHLGVTEAGDNEDGRIKSAVGIGALLADGIGDTIRISLSEDPEAEIPVAKELVQHYIQRAYHAKISGAVFEKALEPNFQRTTISVENIGSDHVPVVFGAKTTYTNLQPDFMLSDNGWEKPNGEPIPVIELFCNEIDEERIKFLPRKAILLITSKHSNIVGDIRCAIHKLMLSNCQLPVVIKLENTDSLSASMQLKAAADLGVLCIDGLINGIYIENTNIPSSICVDTAFSILQAARLRVSKTEYISCPSCGRTLFDLQAVIARIKEQTMHLKGLKIGIMGCIVNGPGEMADADYGYVGAARGKVSLYKKQTCIEKNIPEEKAVEKLIALIKANGDWQKKD